MCCLITFNISQLILMSMYVASLASLTLSAGRHLDTLCSREVLDNIALPELLTMHLALAVMMEHLNNATIYSMAEPCAFCSKVKRYRVRDWFGKLTQLARMIANLLNEALCENASSTICCKYRYKLLCLKKLKKEYEEVKDNLKTQLRVNRASQQPQRWQVLHFRLLSAESIGVLPAGISFLKSCLHCLRFNCLCTSMSKRLRTVINSP